MSYSYTWIPQTERPTGRSRITVRTWDGRTLFGTTVQVKDGKINITVPEKNQYRLTVHTGSVSETVNVTIPRAEPQAPLAERVEEIEQIISLGGGSGSATLIPDPDNEGFFKIVATE